MTRRVRPELTEAERAGRRARTVAILAASRRDSIRESENHGPRQLAEAAASRARGRRGELVGPHSRGRRVPGARPAYRRRRLTGRRAAAGGLGGSCGPLEQRQSRP